jgi:hypothetical protein
MIVLLLATIRQARATHPASQHHRMVTLATSSSSLGSESAFDQKDANVMLCGDDPDGRTLIDWRPDMTQNQSLLAPIVCV